MSAEPRQQLFAVDGLFCGGCARGLERRLGETPGVLLARVHHLSASALVRWEAQRCDVAYLRTVVRQAGYRLIERADPQDAVNRFDGQIRQLTLRLAVSVAFGMWAMAAAIVLYVTPSLGADLAWRLAVASGLLALPALLYGGWDIGRMAIRSVRLRAPGLDLLVTLGVGGAVSASLGHLMAGDRHVYFDTAVMLITLLLTGRLIETHIRRGAAQAVVAMGRLFDDTALVWREADGWQALPSASLRLGDRVRIPAGAVATVDGRVVTGESRLNAAVLNGESAPRAITPGDRVSAGAVNLDRMIEVSVDRDAGDRDVDRMGGRVALELATRGGDEDRIARLAGALTQGLILASVLVTAATLALTADVGEAVMRGLVVLLAACPCALALAAPLAQARLSARAAEHGVRFSDPGVVDRMAGLRTVFLDKTGTLTLGRPEVVAVAPCPGWSVAQVLDLAARAETGVAHPLAQAVVAAAPIGDAVVVGGRRLDRGAETTLADGTHIHVGGVASLQGETRLRVTLDGLAIGDLLLADALDPSAADGVARLKRRGLQVAMATGDAEGPALAVAHRIGLDAAAVHWGCTPADKADRVRNTSGPVLFVGDGVNDAPALTAAACGVSVARAHPAATATAAIVILRGGLEQVDVALSLADETRRTIRQNVVLALAYNIVVLPLAALGLLSPLGAAVAMTASSLLVMLNALRGPQTRLSRETSSSAGDDGRRQARPSP
ncbi:heavy metal translocating P-type ATPase [Brevundimonas staleyi]|uniref:Heavy metal translocating P-type ATPase n=1 Tax=Brevundimonas staleyi TaxID=74326 RepID=A0ABW0FM31_9CAUL|nr:heavy metal translocating P-type ATPase [uncultured Brevundimonas sp.]